MKQLPKERFEHAATWVRENARAPDRAFFDTHLFGAPAGALLNALRPFANPDGGFGHGIEPDFRTPASSPLATTVAFQYLREIGAPADEPLVQGGVRYFLASFDPVQEGWPLSVPAINEAPHAPWWHYEGPPAGFLPNPGAEIVGYLHAYSSLVPPDFLSRVTERTVSALRAQAGPVEMHEFMAYTRLAENLPPPLAGEVWDRLARDARQVACLDPSQWGGYVCRPLGIARTPGTPVAEALRAVLEINLDYAIDEQGEDGTWSPTWEWGTYPETWPQARQDWQGWLTVQMLKTLRAFGRLAG